MVFRWLQSRFVEWIARHGIRQLEPEGNSLATGPTVETDVTGRAGESYPDTLLRGLRSKDWVITSVGRKVISLQAFIPDSPSRRTNEWCPGWLETSINWEDPDGLSFTKSARTTAGSLQAQHGIARLRKGVIADYVSRNTNHDVVRYERSPLDANPFHGNILFHHQLEKIRQKQIAGLLAEEADWIPSA